MSKLISLSQLKSCIVKIVENVKTADNTLQTQLDSANSHMEETINSENGIHGLRYYNGVLQYSNNGTWETISISNSTI